MSAQLDETSLGEVNHGELWMEKLRCKICCSVYTHPLVLHCAHTFCLQCIAKSCKSNYQDDIDCPVCRSKVQFPRGVLSKLPKNHLLLDLMESVGLKDRCLNQKQIHTILTDVSYFVSEFKVYLTLRLVFTKHLTVVLFRLNRGDIRLDFQLNQQMIWNQGQINFKF